MSASSDSEPPVLPMATRLSAKAMARMGMYRNTGECKKVGESSKS